MKLFPYQETGRRWFVNHTSPVLLCADGMGLGKSPEAATAFDSLNLRRVLVTGPAIARPNWQREIRDWTGLESTVLTSLSDRPPAEGIVICSFDYIREDDGRNKDNQVMGPRLLWKAGPWDLIIVDEAHFATKCNDEDPSKRSMALFGPHGLAYYANRVWLLTGTPMPNHAGELWIFATFAGLTTLTYKQWTRTYCKGYQQGGMFRINGTKKEKLDELHQLVFKSGLVLRRTKEEVRLDLPPVTYGQITVEAPYLTDEELLPSFPEYFVGPGCDFEAGVTKRQALEDKRKLEHELLSEAMGDPNDMNDAKLRWLQDNAKAIATLMRYNGLAKVTGLVARIMMELEMDDTRKYAMFAENKGVIEALRQRFKRWGAVTLYGGTPPAKRVKHVDAFNLTLQCNVIIGHFITAGTNISLVGGADMIIVQPPFVPGNLDQAIKRMDRIGQKRPVLARFVDLAGDPLDGAITGMLRRKTAEISAVVDGPKMFSPVVNVDDLL